MVLLHWWSHPPFLLLHSSTSAQKVVIRPTWRQENPHLRELWLQKKTWCLTEVLKGPTGRLDLDVTSDSPMDLLFGSRITDTLCHCGRVFSAVVKWKRLSPRVNPDLFWFPFAVRWQDESQWKWMEGCWGHKSQKRNFLFLNSRLCPQFSVFYLESSAYETRFHPSHCSVTGEDKHQGHTGLTWACCGTQCSTRSSPRHRPRRMTLPVSHLAPAQPVKQWQRKSPFLSSQRTVPPGWQGDGEHWSGISLNRRKERGRRHCGLEKKKNKVWREQLQH